MTLSTVKKSTAITAFAWERMNSTRRASPCRCRLAAYIAQDLPQCRRGNLVAEPPEFAVDAPVSQRR